MNQDNTQTNPSPQDPLQNLADIRQARDQAEIFRDQLLTEFEHINKEDSLLDPDALDDPNRQQGKEAMRKAIAAANRAIASIDKALKSILNNNKNQEDIAKLLEHYIENKPIRWVKVHDLADFVYFDHSRHMQAGLSCIDCHGEVGRMERMTRVNSLKMKWCLDCHQQEPTETTSELYQRQVFKGRVGLRGPIHCSACHR